MIISIICLYFSVFLGIFQFKYDAATQLFLKKVQQQQQQQNIEQQNYAHLAVIGTRLGPGLDIHSPRMQHTALHADILHSQKWVYWRGMAILMVRKTVGLMYMKIRHTCKWHGWMERLYCPSMPAWEDPFPPQVKIPPSTPESQLQQVLHCYVSLCLVVRSTGEQVCLKRHSILDVFPFLSLGCLNLFLFQDTETELYWHKPQTHANCGRSVVASRVIAI